MTETAPDRFAAWLSNDIRPALSERGFTKIASNFHKRAPAGWGVVNFQKSQFGSRLETRFTINLGVSLDRLTTARGGDPSKKPPEYRCVWRTRIAAAVDDPNDRWWDVDHETDLVKLTAEGLPLLIDRGLPLIEQRLTEEGFVASLDSQPRVGHIAFFTEAQIIELLGTPGPTT
jgi:Domain of unknown function (DUF4304)